MGSFSWGDITSAVKNIAGVAKEVAPLIQSANDIYVGINNNTASGIGILQPPNTGVNPAVIYQQNPTLQKTSSAEQFMSNTVFGIPMPLILLAVGAFFFFKKRR